MRRLVALALAIAAILSVPARAQTNSAYPTIPYTQIQNTDFIMLEGTRFTIPVYTTFPIMAQWLQAHMGLANFTCAGSTWAKSASAGATTCTQPSFADISGVATTAQLPIGTSGATVPLLNGANTWSGASSYTAKQTFTSSGLGGAIFSSQTGAGTMTVPAGPYPFGFVYNLLNISSDAIDGGTDLSNTVIGFGVRMASGGSTEQGSRTAGYFENVFTAASKSTNVSRFWSGMGAVARIQSNDGGTVPSPKGAAIGGYSAALFDAGAAANFANATAHEFNISVPADSYAAYKSIIQLASLPADATHGGVEGMIALSGSIGSVKWNNGILLTDANGIQPIATAGCIICTSFTGNPTVASLIDLSAYRPSSYIVNAYGFKVTGAGQTTIGLPSVPATWTGGGLEVSNNDVLQMRFSNIAASAVNSYDIGRSSATGMFNFYGNQTGFVGYIWGGIDGEQMRSNATGLGVGNNNPTYKLDVAGSERVTGARIAGGSAPTITGCTVGTQVGGTTAGKFSATAICAIASTYTLTGLPTAPNGYSCDMNDRTTAGVVFQPTGDSVNTAAFTVRSVAVANADVIQFKCMAF